MKIVIVGGGAQTHTGVAGLIKCYSLGAQSGGHGVVAEFHFCVSGFIFLLGQKSNRCRIVDPTRCPTG